jgi:CRP/FNR family transcriptional regulator, anaerobic regulatory protein
MMQIDLLTELRERFAFFEYLTPELACEIVEQSTLKSLSQGARLPSASCDVFPLLLDGLVKVVAVAENGREIVLYRVEPGQGCVLHTSTLFQQSAPPVVVYVAESNARVLLVPQTLFHRLMEQAPAFRNTVCSEFSSRVLELAALVDAIAFHKLDRRLAALVLGKGSVIYSTHQALAQEVGSVREIVSRVLSNFAAKGVVALKREHIEVLDPLMLRHIADGMA